MQWSPRYPLNKGGVACPPQAPGVYRLYMRTSYNNLRVFYVGGSENLRHRMAEHTPEREKDPCLRQRHRVPCEFDYMVVRSPADRLRLQHELVRAMRPECNAEVATQPGAGSNAHQRGSLPFRPPAGVEPLPGRQAGVNG